VRRLVCITVLTVTLGACGCKSKGSTTTGNNHAVDPAACDGLRDRVHGLYAAAAPAPAGESPEAAKLRQQEVADNTEMVLVDCRREPARVAPCAEKAPSVDALERDCLLPLDDDGKAEGDYFRARAKAGGAPSK